MGFFNDAVKTFSIGILAQPSGGSFLGDNNRRQIAYVVVVGNKRVGFADDQGRAQKAIVQNVVGARQIKWPFRWLADIITAGIAVLQQVCVKTGNNDQTAPLCKGVPHPRNAFQFLHFNVQRVGIVLENLPILFKILGH